jgi:hypothetical protein
MGESIGHGDVFHRALPGARREPGEVHRMRAGRFEARIVGRVVTRSSIRPGRSVTRAIILCPAWLVGRLETDDRNSVEPAEKIRVCGAASFAV